jgi:hypothetical protein
VVSLSGEGVISINLYVRIVVGEMKLLKMTQFRTQVMFGVVRIVALHAALFKNS